MVTIRHKDGQLYYESISGDIPVDECLCGAWHNPSCPVKEHRLNSRVEFPPTAFYRQITDCVKRGRKKSYIGRNTMSTISPKEWI